MTDFLTLETTQGPVVVRRGAIDMLVPVSDSETVVTVGTAQLIVKATLEDLDLGVDIPEGWFRPLADAPDKLAAMRAAGVSSARVQIPAPQPRAGSSRAPTPITAPGDLPKRPVATPVAAPQRPAPKVPDIRAQVEASARAALPKPVPPGAPAKVAPTPPRKATKAPAKRSRKAGAK